MPILEICSMMLLLDCSNPIVVHSMALKHGALIHQIINAFVYHGTKVFETFYDYHILRKPVFLGHCWDSLIFIVNCINVPYVFCVQYRITTILWFLLVASNNANSPLGYNIAHFRNSYGIDIFPDVCVKKNIHPPQLDNEQHMIISELNMLLLAKGEMYNVDGFTKSNIDTFIKLIVTDVFV